MGIVCRSYTLAPSVAWHELGRQPLGPRGRLRLTRAVSELQFIDHALGEVTRERGPKDAPPEPGVMMAVEEVVRLYTADQEIDLTTIADDDAEADTAADDADTIEGILV